MVDFLETLHSPNPVTYVPPLLPLALRTPWIGSELLAGSSCRVGGEPDGPQLPRGPGRKERQSQTATLGEGHCPTEQAQEQGLRATLPDGRRGRRPGWQGPWAAATHLLVWKYFSISAVFQLPESLPKYQPCFRCLPVRSFPLSLSQKL